MTDGSISPPMGDQIDIAIYTTLTSVNRLFGQSLDSPEGDMLTALADLLARKLDLAIALIGVLPEGGDWVEVLSISGGARGHASQVRIAARQDLPEGRGAAGEALRAGRVIAKASPEEEFRFQGQVGVGFDIGGGMAVPFRFPRGQKGVISLYSRRDQSFPAHLEDLLDQIASDITDFLRRRREHEQLSRLRNYQAVVGDLLHKLLSIPDPNTAFIEVTQLVTERTDATGAWVSVPDGKELRTVAGRCKDSVQGLARDMWNFRPRLYEDGSAASRSVAATAFRSGAPYIAYEGASSHLSGLKTLFLSLESIEVAGAWPIVVSGKPVAVLELVSEDPDYFSVALVNLLEQLIDGISIAIQNFETQSESRRISRVYQALLTEGDLLITAESEDDFLFQSCKRLLESGLYRTVWIGVLKDHGYLQPLVSVGDNTSELELLTKRALGEVGNKTASMKAIDLGETVVVDDYVNDPGNAKWAEIARRNNWCSSVSVPINRFGMPWGVLSVMSDRINGFSEDMVDLLSRVSQMISHGLSEIDLREQLNSEREKQSWLASHDPLTGLPNRRGLEDHISEAMARSRRHGTLLVVGMLDLDDFKVVNDTYGHELGDQALRDLTKSLRELLRQTDLLARVGGDEFVLVLEDVRRPSDLNKILQNFDSVLNSPLLLPDGNRLKIGGSLGLSVYSGDSLTPNELLHSADQALYLLKSRKGYRRRAWAFHSTVYPDGLSSLPGVEFDGGETAESGDFRDLLYSGGLEILYQPILRLSTGKVVGVEALSRLVSPSGVTYLPGKFIPQLGLDDQNYLTLELHSRVERDLLALDKTGSQLWCSINVASDLIRSDHHLSDLLQGLSGSKLSPSRLTLEVLDSSSFLSSPDAWRRLISLSEKGLELAIDDIGDTYPSLLRVQDLPVGKVKLGQEFVRNLSKQPSGFRFLIAMSELSQNLNVGFIAEGVETPEILDALISLEVEFAQGFAISPPLSFGELEGWLGRFNLDVESARPSTLLGLYALFVRDSFGHYQKLLKGHSLEALDQCAVPNHLTRLGLVGSEIDKAHNDYHKALSSYRDANHLKPNPHLRAVEESRERLRRLFLERLDPGIQSEL